MRRFLLAALLAGCVTGPRLDEVGSDEEAVMSSNLLSSNLLSSNLLSLNLLSSNLLSSNQLSSGVYSLNTTASSGLEQTDDGRQLLTYLARCSLPAGTSLQATVGGVSYSFPGLLGLAPQWLNQTLNSSAKHWVSACLLGHVNAFGVSVPISVGASGTLVTTVDERSLYSVYEATFYGNVFDRKANMYACIGTDKAIAMALSPYRQWRVCADGDSTGTSVCGFTTIGPCSAWCNQPAPDGYLSCRVNNSNTNYPETISIWLQHF